jgi:hypothetical protein
VDADRARQFPVLAPQEGVFIGKLENARVETRVDLQIYRENRVAEFDVARQHLVVRAIVLEVHEAHLVLFGKAPEAVYTKAVLVLEIEFVLPVDVRAVSGRLAIEPHVGIEIHEEPAQAHLEVLFERAAIAGRLTSDGNCEAKHYCGQQCGGMPSHDRFS